MCYFVNGGMNTAGSIDGSELIPMLHTLQAAITFGHNSGYPYSNFVFLKEHWIQDNIDMMG